MGSAGKIFIKWLAVWEYPQDVNCEWVRMNSRFHGQRRHAEACI